MLLLEIVAAWFAGALLLALLAGKTMAGMARVAGEHLIRSTPPATPARPAAPVAAQRTAA